MASVSTEVNLQHKSLMIRLCEMMDPNDQTYKNFIYCLETYIPKKMLYEIKQSPTDVFSLMEEKGILKAGKYHILKEALKASGYINVLDVLKNEEECIARQMRKRSYSDGPMACGSSNNDAPTVSSIEPEGIKKLRDDLIEVYRTLEYVPASPICKKRIKHMDSIYVDIVIEKEEESKYDTQRMNAQTHSEKIIKVTSYKQIFLNEQGLKFKRVYLRGKGGYGKTTFCKKVLHAWCNAHEKRVTSHGRLFQDEDVLQTFDLLFYINLREVSDQEENLIEVIYDQFDLKEIPDKNDLGTLLKVKGDKVLFILDGLDEMIGKPKFLEYKVICKSYQNCCFLISSRPWKISKMELQEGTKMDLLLDLTGFSKENAIKCAQKIFENLYSNGNAIEQFMKYIEVNKLATQLIHVPLLLFILTQVWLENKMSLPSKLHELYILFLDLLTDRAKDKKDPNHRQMRFTLGDMQSPLPSKVSNTSFVKNFGEGLFVSLCEVAHHFLFSSQKENSLVFRKTILLDVLGDRGEEKLDIALDLGVLSVTDSVYYIYRTMNVSFLHKTFQEFFTAACLILNPDKLNIFISSIEDFNDVLQNEIIIVFLVGLMPEVGNSVLEKVNELCKDDWEALNKMELMNQKRSNGILSDVFVLSSVLINQPEFYRLCNVSDICLKCNEEMMGENMLLNVSGLVLQQKIFDLHTWNPAFLQSLILMGCSYGDLLVDLRGLTGLGYLRLEGLSCELYLPESGSLSVINMMTLTLSSCCCDVLRRTLTRCTKLLKLAILQTDINSCLLDLSNMTELTFLHMSDVALSSSCCDVLGNTLTHCTKLKELIICNLDLQNCVLDVSSMTELRFLIMSMVTLSSRCCDKLGSTLTHCTKLESLEINNIDLNNCVLDLSNLTELTSLDMIMVTMYNNCCDVFGRTLTHCTKLRTLYVHDTDFQDCLLDFRNMTELTVLDMSKVKLSSSCWDRIGRTLTQCTKLKKLKLNHINLHNCVLNLSNMRELTVLDMSDVTLSSSCCDVIGSTLTHCTKLKGLVICNTYLHNCVLDLSNMAELTVLELSSALLSSSCDVIGNILTHCTKLVELIICNTDVLKFCIMKEPTSLEMFVETVLSSCFNVTGNTLTHNTKLDELKRGYPYLHNSHLDVSNMTELTVLAISEVTLSSNCCDVLGSILKRCTKLHILYINNMNLHNCDLNLSNMPELLGLYMLSVTLSSSCCDVLGNTLTHCTKLEKLIICNTDLHNCLLDLSNMTELTYLCMSEVTLSSNCCDVLGSTLTHCTKLTVLRLENTDLNNCMLDLSLIQLQLLRLMEVTLSSSACQVLEQLKARKTHFRRYTYERLPSDNDKWKVNFHDPSEICATSDHSRQFSSQLQLISNSYWHPRHGLDSI